VINKIINIIRSKNVIKDITCLLLVNPIAHILFPKLGFRLLVVTSLIFVARHIYRQTTNKNNIAPKMEINHTILF
jgi:hypothetical protein